MGSTYIDTAQYIQKYKDMPISDGNTRMGHVHLKIGNIAMGRDFYQKILMLDEMNTNDATLFVSRDGYHHHLGMNTWESLGATKRTPKTYGLRSFELIYHDLTLYSQIRENLEKNNFPILQKNNSIQTEDPWGNIILISQK